MNTELRPEIDTINKPYWDGLAEGKLLFQRCSAGHAWLPARAACPTCLSTDWSWQQAEGIGRIKSWVVYHHAYHPAFKEKLPYNVTLVELAEGPQLLTNVLGPNEELAAEREVTLDIDTSAPVPLAHFRFTGSPA
jgi:uncharacterized protein